MPSPDVPDTKFKVLEQSRAQALERARQVYGNSHLVLDALYAEARLLDDAERELELMARANPRSRAAHQLLRRIKAIRKK